MLLEESEREMQSYRAVDELQCMVCKRRKLKVNVDKRRMTFFKKAESKVTHFETPYIG